MPIDGTARRHDAGNVFSKLQLQRRLPRQALEPHPIIDHGEPAGGESPSSSTISAYLAWTGRDMAIATSRTASG
jgi:hypothetical protein